MTDIIELPRSDDGHWDRIIVFPCFIGFGTDSCVFDQKYYDRRHVNLVSHVMVGRRCPRACLRLCCCDLDPTAE